MNPDMHDYLLAMGVQTWTPRVALPGAKQTVLAVEQLLDRPAEGTPSVTSVVPVLDKEKRKSSAVNRSSFRDMDFQDSHPFAMLALLYPGNCLLVGDFPVEKESYLSSAQHRLLSDLLFTLGVADPESAKPQFFTWPQQKQERDQNGNLALEAVQAFLTAQTSGQKIRFVLIMGESSARYILPHEASLASSRGKLWSVLDFPALITDSLDRLLEQPLLKREVWRDIQPLCRLIANGA